MMYHYLVGFLKSWVMLLNLPQHCGTFKVKDPEAYFFREILYDDYTKPLLIILSS